MWDKIKKFDIDEHYHLIDEHYHLLAGVMLGLVFFCLAVG
jgi:hypothetical protein